MALADGRGKGQKGNVMENTQDSERVPETRGRPAGPIRVAIVDLNVGESLLCAYKELKSVSGTACNVGKRMNRRFCCRTTREGIRVWRIE